MPELPEVETVVRTLAPRLVGSTITAVRLNRRDILVPDDCDLSKCLIGRRIQRLHRRGKRIVFELDNANRFYIHLGMTGQLTLERSGSLQVIHTHLVISTNAPADVHFRDPRRFGGIWWLGDQPIDDCMGPEPLSLSTPHLRKLLAKTSRAIKTALMDQTFIAGLGNIYVDESLFHARVHPLQPANSLRQPQITRLNRAIKQILRKAIDHRGSTLRDYRDGNGEAGNFQDRHRVYGRNGEPCFACKRAIERIVLGGRSTHFCARCQTFVSD